MSADDKKIVIKADRGRFGAAQGRKKSMRVLVFALGDEKYCVDIKVAREAVGMRRVTKVPNTPDFVLGVMNLRGEIVSLIDIAYFLGLSEHARTENTRVIVCDVKGMTAGLVVDSIYKALDIDPEIIQPTLATVKGRLAEYTRGQADTEEGILVFLDLGKLLGSEEIERLKGGK